MHIVNSLMQCLALKHPESTDPRHGFKKAELGPQFHSLPNGTALESRTGALDRTGETAGTLTLRSEWLAFSASSAP
jgi:hypothetical protein